MWFRVSLRNYRSIKHAEVELAPFTVVVGPNGSGKSNFVDALVLASELGFDAVSAIQARGGFAAIRRWGIEEDEAIQGRIRAGADHESLDTFYVEHAFSLVPDNGSGWKFSDETYEEKEPGKEALKLTRSGGDVGQENPFTFWPLPPTTSITLIGRQLVPWKTIEAHCLRLDLPQMRAPQPPGDAGRLIASGRNIASVLSRLRSEDPRGFEFVLAAMRRLIPGLEDINVKDVGGFLSLRFSQQQDSGVADFTTANMSEGALRALGIIVAAQTITAHDLLIVEEPEVAIHPGAAALLFEVLKRASHSGSVLSRGN